MHRRRLLGIEHSDAVIRTALSHPLKSSPNELPLKFDPGWALLSMGSTRSHSHWFYFSLQVQIAAQHTASIDYSSPGSRPLSGLSGYGLAFSSSPDRCAAVLVIL